MSSTVPPSGAPRKTPKRNRPRTAGELVERLAEPHSSRSRLSTGALLRLFRTKTAIATSPDERQALAEQLRRLDPTWEARATIVWHDLPELARDSTATLAHEIVREARVESAFPASGVTDRQAFGDWLAKRWRADASPGPRTMPWVAIAAMFDDRHHPEFPDAVALALAGPLNRRSVKGPPPIERLMSAIADPPKGLRLAECVHAVLQPFLRRADRATELEAELANAAKRSAANRREADELRERLVEVEARARAAEVQAVASEQAAASRVAEIERRIAETEGRAQQRVERNAATFGLEVRSLADDIVMYLERESPNLDGARRRAEDLRRVADRLEADR